MLLKLLFVIKFYVKLKFLNSQFRSKISDLEKNRLIGHLKSLDIYHTTWLSTFVKSQNNMSISQTWIVELDIFTFSYCIKVHQLLFILPLYNCLGREQTESFRKGLSQSVLIHTLMEYLVTMSNFVEEDVRHKLQL